MLTGMRHTAVLLLGLVLVAVDGLIGPAGLARPQAEARDSANMIAARRGMVEFGWLSEWSLDH